MDKVSIRDLKLDTLLEAALLSAAGGLVGVGAASLLGFLITLVAPGCRIEAAGRPCDSAQSRKRTRVPGLHPWRNSSSIIWTGT